MKTSAKTSATRTTKNGHLLCSALNRRGEPCGRVVVQGMTVCRLHGGLTPKGAASPHYKTGKYSAYLPSGLAAKYEEALADPELLNLNNEIALVDAMIAGLLETKQEQAKDGQQELPSTLPDLLDLRRKLATSEMRRLITLQGVMTVDQAMLLVSAMLAAVQENVTDPVVLARIQHSVRSLLYRQPSLSANEEA